MRHLGITHKHSVDVKIQTAISAFKRQYSAHSIGIVAIIPAVNSDRDIVRDIRRVVGYRVGDIRILRLVMPMELPVGRHRHFFAAWKHGEIVLHVNDTVIIAKVPLSVQQFEPRGVFAGGKRVLAGCERYEIAVLRKRSDMQRLRILMVNHAVLGRIFL